MNSMDLLKERIEKAGLAHSTLLVDRNGFIKQAGSIDTNLYLIKSGSLRVYNIINGEEHCLYLGHKKSAITAVDSFFSGVKLKMVLTALLFALAFKFLVLLPIPFFVMFCLVMVMPLISPLFFKKYY